MPVLVDVDVHERLRNARDLLPYLAPPFRPYLTDYSWPGLVKLRNPFPVDEREEWRQPDGAFSTDPTYLRKHLIEGLGVSHPILNGTFQMSAMTGHHEFAAALATAYNDWQIATWLENEPSLRGSVHIAAHDPQAAAREIDRVAEHPQIAQVFLPLVADRQYGDPFYLPIFEAAAKHRLPVAFHHGTHTPTVVGFPRYYVEWHTVAGPVAAQHQLMSLIANGLFDRLPELKVVFLESGVSWLPWFIWRADQQYREMRVEIPWVKRLPSDHIRESVRVATHPLREVPVDHFLKLVEIADSERVFLFASNYPNYDADTPSEAVLNQIPDTLRERILFRNALDTYPRLQAGVKAGTE